MPTKNVSERNSPVNEKIPCTTQEIGGGKKEDRSNKETNVPLTKTQPQNKPIIMGLVNIVILDTLFSKSKSLCNILEPYRNRFSNATIFFAILLAYVYAVCFFLFCFCDINKETLLIPFSLQMKHRFQFFQCIAVVQYTLCPCGKCNTQKRLLKVITKDMNFF